ncbi:MAG: molybdopterin cofactor-binding domain-containing protein, partial [Pirellulaceae bacterium]
QCGFCTPGFIVEGIHFYDCWRAAHGNSSPSREEIALAMSGHLCRCAAYTGIYEAIRAACAGDCDDIGDFEYPRHDGVAKVTGHAKYTVDVHYHGMLVGKLLGSPHAHAAVKTIDTSKALTMPGVKAIIDVLDDPHRVVRYVGQPILAIAAADEDTVFAAIEAIEIDFDVCPFVVDDAKARSPDSPVVYPESKKKTPNASEGPIPPGKWEGNVRTPYLNMALSHKKGRARKTLQQAREGQPGLHLIEHTFVTPAQTHTALEPHCSVAIWESENRLTLHTSSQNIFVLANEVAKHYKLKRENVTIYSEYIGGAFGAKQGMRIEHTAAIELAREAGAPVKLVYDRLEEMVLGGFRPTARIEFSLVTDDDAQQRGITAMCYGSCGTAVQSQNAPWLRVMYGGPKHLADFDIATNWGAARPFRGPCGPSAFWALESAVDEAAHRLKIDPLELRRKWDRSDVRDKLYDWVESIPEWKDRDAVAKRSGRFRIGIGMAAGNWFNAFHNATRVKLESTPEGVVASCAVQDMGQGSRSVIGKAVADELGVSLRDIEVQIGDSALVKGPVSSASRTTTSLYPTSTEAAGMLKAKLISAASSQMDLANARWDSGGIRHDSGHVPLTDLLKQLPPQSVTSAKRGGNGTFDVIGRMPTGNLGISFFLKMTGSVCVIQTLIDTLLGTIKPQKVWMGMSFGKVVNPELCHSQACGAIMQSLGFALTEERQYDPHTGTLLSFGLEDYRIPGIGDVPEMEIYFDESKFQKMRGGACGMSELATIPIPAALGNAIFHATGWRPTELPMRPHRVLEHVKE